MAWISTVTAKGLELMQAWITGGGVLTVTGAKGGTEAVDESVLYAQEGVSGDAHTLTMTNCRQESASSGTVLRADKNDGAAGYLLEYCEKKVQQG